MLPRAPLIAFLLSIVLPLSVACQPTPLLSDVSISAPTVSPNGDSLDDEVTIRYTIGRAALVSIVLRDAAGREYLLRDREPRSVGSYQAPFNGVAPVNDGKATRRVMPDGRYSFVVIAEDLAGERAEAGGEVTIVDGDHQPVTINNLVISLPGAAGQVAGAGVDSVEISPNGDGAEDEAIISYGISRDAEVVVFAKDPSGRIILLDERKPRKAALYTHYWNGMYNGRLVPDGVYAIHVQAFDKAGNVSEEVRSIVVRGAGKPDLRITRVDFTPNAIPIGGTLNVTIRVRNFGDVPIKTMGPPSGTHYRTDQTFNYWTDETGTPKYFERSGRWRVAVSWNTAGSPYPIRWGLFEDVDRELLPGEEAVITGTITVLPRQREFRVWAAVEQGGVGFPGGEVGLKTIIVDY
ncbi:MAG: hypothetical protein KatS3mg060_3141 [Dehalococcoidia bacterium]|nr:MAG: hypothetical protein KatS3mg060_3141 [Dehalococcoidia bacterium]